MIFKQLDEKNRIFNVHELNLAIKSLLEHEIPLLWVRGEVSNLTKAASGHYYFSLKDNAAQVRCVMFRHKAVLLKTALLNGQQIEILASASLYEARGEFQLTIEQLRPAGIGILYEQFAQLKQTLEQQGYFSPERKRAIPAFPRRIGIVTSPQAAALRDVLSTLKLRLPTVPIILYPTPVQGDGSAEKIAAAITSANNRAECDVLIVCRGGGSIEDLWAFNEPIVAYAIFNSQIPVISGVGHETDFTIADFVADLRAPTPTAAAQAAVQDRATLHKLLNHHFQRLRRALNSHQQSRMQTIDYLQRRLIHPEQKVRHQKQQLQQLQQRLQQTLRLNLQQQNWRYRAVQQRLHNSSKQLQQRYLRLAQLGNQLQRAAQMHHTQQQTRLAHLSQQLTLLNPQNVLARGYSLVQNQHGKLITQAEQTHAHEELKITFAQGEVVVTVK